MCAPPRKARSYGSNVTLALVGVAEDAINIEVNRRVLLHPSSMRMLMVDVGIMRMLVLQRRVLVCMGVWFNPVPVEVMQVLVVRIVAVGVNMVQGQVLVGMAMFFGQVQPNANRHQCGGKPEQRAGRFAKHSNRQRSADKRRGGEIGTGAGGAKATQGQYKQHQTQAVSEETDQQRTG